MKCKVTFTYNPEPDEVDEDDRSDCPSCYASPDPCPACLHREAMQNVERAAREVTAMLEGEPGMWTLGDTIIEDDEAANALLSLHDYLHDVDRARRCGPQGPVGMSFREQTVDVLYAHGFSTAAKEIEAGRKGPYWGAWHVERRVETYGDRARNCFVALRRLAASGEDSPLESER